jgi:hypothetical protein
MKSSVLLAHFAAAVILTCVILLVYASVQQAHRSAANDPQLQIARDFGIALSSGKAVNNLFLKTRLISLKVLQYLQRFSMSRVSHYDQRGF